MFGSSHRYPDKPSLKGPESTIAITGITSFLIITLLPYIHFLHQKRAPTTKAAIAIAIVPARDTYIYMSLLHLNL